MTRTMRTMFPAPRRPGARWLALGAPIAAALACASTPPPPAAAPAASAPASPEDQALPADPATRTGTLPNGLRYYIRRNKEPEKRAAFRLVVDAGSVLEEENQQGLAHYVEHMAFNGTRLLGPRDVFDFMEKAGMRSGRHTNAYTSQDETVYMFEVPTDDKPQVHQTLVILQQIAAEIAFAPAEVERERGVILEERRLGLGASQRVREKMLPILLRGSPYSTRLPIGKKEVLEKASADDLRAFYERWYRPDLMALVAVGDFEEAAIEQEIRAVFAGLTRPSAPAARPSPPVPDHDETLVAVVKDKELTDTTVFLVQKIPARPTTTRRRYREALVESLYHAMLNARFEEIRRAANPPFLGAGSGTDRYVRANELFLHGAFVKQGEVAAGLAALNREITRVDRFGFVAGELQRGKADLLLAYEQALKEKDKTHSAKYAQEAANHFLTGTITPGPEAELALAREMLPAISLDEVNRVVRQWISTRNRVIFIRSPEGGAVPPEADLLAVMSQAEGEKLTPYVDTVSQGPLVAKLPPPGPVTGTRRIPEVGVTEWRLPNGVRVVVKPTDFKNDEVLVTAFSPGGHSRVSLADYESAIRTSDIVPGGGLGSLSVTQLGKALAGKSVALRVYLQELEEGLSARSSPDHLATLLELIHLTFTAPRRDEEAFAAYLADQREAVARRLADPTTAFWDRWRTLYYNDHPRWRAPEPKHLDQVKLDRALRIYKDRFADAGDFTFVFVGKVDPEQLRPLAERYLGNLPARGRKESWRDVGARPPRTSKRFQMKSGVDQKATVALELFGDGVWNRKDEHLLESVSEALSLRLRDVLREDLGGTYSVHVNGSFNRRPYQGSSAYVEFSCGPENVKKLLDAVHQQIRKVQTDGFSPEELAKIKAAQTRALEEALRTNGYWLDQLANSYRFASDPRFILEEKKLTEALDAPTLKAAAQRFFASKRQLLGILEPGAPPAAAAAK